MQMKEAIDAEFTPLPTRLAYFPTDSKSVYTIRWSRLFAPSDTAKNWDGNFSVPTTHCMWSDVGDCYIYITLKLTGRKTTRIPGTDTWGIKVQITFNAGTEDTSTASGWVIAA